MRLNLPSYSCSRFELHADFDVPLSAGPAISSVMEQTHNDVSTTGTDTKTARFGSRLYIDGIIHRAFGQLSMTPNEGRLDIGLIMQLNEADSSLPAPPRRMKPVTALIAVAAQLFDPTDVSCESTFEYGTKQGHISKITLPIPLLAPANPDGITHIEAATFSNRTGDGIQYHITITQSDDTGLVIHIVEFESTTDWSRRSIRGLLNRARDISTQLLVPKGEH